MTKETFNFKYYIRSRFFPHIWCPGCGHGIVLGSLLRAVHELGLNKNEIVITSGIGCSSRISGYVDFHSLHTIHGRALTFATGVKLSKPSLKAIVPMGDGDALAIGGNHFIHAARRNLDITAIIINNQIYGMTGGQASPTTPYGAYSTTSSFSNIEHAFSIAELAVAAGASFVARGTVYHAVQLDKLIEKGISKNGFSVVEVMSNCHVQFGRRNKMSDPATMLNWFKDQAISAENGSSMPPDSLHDKFTIGILADVDKPDYIEEYKKIRKKAKGK